MSFLKTSQITVASGASTSSSVYLSAAYRTLGVQVGSMSTAVQFAVQVSPNETSWYPVYHPSINSATVATNPYVISQVVGANGGFVSIPYAGPGSLRFVGTGVVSGGVIFNVIQSD